MDSVRPLRAAAPATAHKPVRPRAEPVLATPPARKAPPANLAQADFGALLRSGVGAKARASVRPAPSGAPTPPPATLDGGWDRRLAKGMVIPDVTVDLHGHTLHSAHDLLDTALARAIGRGDRVILLVTGKPPRPESERPHARGAIRAAVGDWIAASRHAGSIAAIRGAHPRHGGTGALYLILRRPRDAKS